MEIGVLFSAAFAQSVRRHEPTLGFRNEMPKKVIERKVATENQEYRYHEMNGQRHQYRPFF